MAAVAIREIGASAFDEPAFLELLRDSVDSGASIGFLAPLTADEGRAFWRSALSELADGSTSGSATGAPASCRTMRKGQAEALIRP